MMELLTAHLIPGDALGTYGKTWEIIGDDDRLVATTTSKKVATAIVTAQALVGKLGRDYRLPERSDYL
jgi:hypothetical protein